MNLKPVPNKLAATSLTLGILGWVIYLLQWCFDLTIGLLLAAVTAGSSAICSTVLDFLPFALWLVGIVAGHVALGPDWAYWRSWPRAGVLGPGTELHWDGFHYSLYCHNFYSDCSGCGRGCVG